MGGPEVTRRAETSSVPLTPPPDLLEDVVDNVRRPLSPRGSRSVPRRPRSRSRLVRPVGKGPVHVPEGLQSTRGLSGWREEDRVPGSGRRDSLRLEVQESDTRTVRWDCGVISGHDQNNLKDRRESTRQDCTPP